MVDAQFTVIEATLKGFMKWKRHNQQAEDYVSVPTIVC